MRYVSSVIDDWPFDCRYEKRLSLSPYFGQKSKEKRKKFVDCKIQLRTRFKNNSIANPTVYVIYERWSTCFQSISRVISQHWSTMFFTDKIEYKWSKIGKNDLIIEWIEREHCWFHVTWERIFRVSIALCSHRDSVCCFGVFLTRYIRNFSTFVEQTQCHCNILNRIRKVTES